MEEKTKENKKSSNILITTILSIILVVMVVACGTLIYHNVFKTSNVHKIEWTNKAIYRTFSSKFMKEQEKSDKGYKGELLSKEGIKQNVFVDSKYSGISNDYYLGKKKVSHLKQWEIDRVKGIVVYYNPNVLNEKTLSKYYKEVISKKHKGAPRNYYLLDVYNKNYGMHFTSDSHYFEVGNFNNKLDKIDNGRVLSCTVEKSGDIKAYYRDKYNHEKETSFII